MEERNVREVADGLMELLGALGYSEAWRREAGRVLQDICRLHAGTGRDGYCQQVVDAYVEGVERQLARGELHAQTCAKRARVARYLKEYAAGGTVDAARIVGGGPKLAPGLAAALEAASSNPEWSESTREATVDRARPFLKWLQERGRDSLASVNEADVRAYFVELSGRAKPWSVYNARNSLRRLFAHLHAEALVASDFAEAMSFPVRREHGIKRPASPEETALVLSSIDRGTAKGKRDYAMLMLGAVLGMRRSDVAGLELGDIDWARGELRVRQSKTGRTMALPLTCDVGEALRDYILHGRQEAGDAHVFLTFRTPVRPVDASAPYNVLNGYRAGLGLPKAPFHGLRRAVATSLVAAGSPISTVAQMLGHSDIEPTKQYISLDVASMKSVSLGLEGLPPLGRDGLPW